MAPVPSQTYYNQTLRANVTVFPDGSQKVLYDDGNVGYNPGGYVSIAPPAWTVTSPPRLNTNREDPPMESPDKILERMTKDALHLAHAHALEERFPSEPPDESVVSWLETVGPKRDQKTLRYLAVRCEEHWYITGSQGNTVMRWDQLRQRIGQKPCQIAPTQWLEVPRQDVPSGADAKSPEEWLAFITGKGKAAEKAEGTSPAE